MDEKTIFYTLFVIFFYYRFNEVQNLLNLGLYFGCSFFEKIVIFLNNDVFVGFDEIISLHDTIVEKEEKHVIKYEDKFLADIRKMEKEYIFDEAELKLLEEKRVFFYNEIVDTRENKMKELTNKLSEIELQYNSLLKEELKEEVKEENNYDSDGEECIFYGSYDELTKEEKIENLLYDKKRMLCEIKELEASINYEKDKEESCIQARNYIINKRIEKLENCFIMESTPQGNVLMIYDNKRSSFKFYSDSTIPYRYLEVVGRKYVKMFDCRPLYVDMEEELNLAEKRWEKERKEKEDKEEQEKKQKEEQKVKPVEKKNVFAKFKSYNKEGGSGRVNIGVPPKNSIPMTKEQENEKIILKEKANRYTYEGKMANFNFLKKVDRKVVDKKYGLSFADFKKMQKSAK
jgi:hypothetical protein